jgi:ubiquitin C-terminal hydrolase
MNYEKDNSRKNFDNNNEQSSKTEFLNLNKEKEKNKVLNYEITKNIGFTNIGNTCFMNSFLQILLHTPTFLPKLKEYYYETIEENTLAYNLIKLSEYPYDTKYLKEIKKIISETCPKYGPFTQNDTQIFAIDFIDALINEIKNEKSFTSESNEGKDKFEITKIEDNIIYKTKKYKEFKSNIEKLGEKTFIEDIFLLIESRIKYKELLIMKNKISFDLLLNIELSFPLTKLKEKYTLYELLDLKYSKYNTIIRVSDNHDNNNKSLSDTTTKKNGLDEKSIGQQKENNIFYDKFKNFLHTINIFRIFNGCCEKKRIIKDTKYFNSINNKINDIQTIDTPKQVVSKEITKIVYFPKVLIISFVRGIEGKDLISSSISFDEEIDLKDYIDKDLTNKNSGTRYKLYAINIREGYTTNFGHCYSYVKINNEWICFNDSYVHKEEPSFNLNTVAELYYIKDDI